MDPSLPQDQDWKPGGADVSGNPPAGGWRARRLRSIEDLSDAVLGAGLEAMQMDRAPLTGSLAFTEYDGVIYSSGLINGRVSLRGPLSEQHVTIGLGLAIGQGTRHWLNEVCTGNIGVFHPGDEHDAYYTPGSLYATASLSMECLEARAARVGLVLDRVSLGGTGVHPHNLPSAPLEHLRQEMEQVHQDDQPTGQSPGRVPDQILDLIIGHFGRLPRAVGKPPSPQGLARIVSRARDYIEANLPSLIRVDDIARAAQTSRRTLYRAFSDVLEESPYTYVRKRRLHKVRAELLGCDPDQATISRIANLWGVTELGRFARDYRQLYGELPSATVSQTRRPR